MSNPESIAVFFDIQNLYHSSKIYGGSKISYKDLIAEIGKGREVKRATAYAAHRSEKDVHSFHKALKASNIDVVSKRVSFRKDDQNEKGKLTPAHFDVEIATDSLMSKIEISDLDTIVLCTGNGAFDYLVEALVEVGLKVEIWSFEGSTSKNLINACTKFQEIPKSCLLSAHQTDNPKEVTSATRE